MKIKIFSVLALTASVVTAAPYAGLSLGFSSMKDSLKFTGKDFDVAQNFDFAHNKSSRLNSFMFGLLGGYAFKLNDKVSFLAEMDFAFGSKKKTLAKFDAHPEGYAFDKVEITSRRKHSFGFMPAVSYNFNDKLSGLLGLRLNWTKHEVTAHVTDMDFAQNKLVKSSKHVMGVEPTLGLGFKINDKISTRLTVGYNFGQKKTMLSSIETAPRVLVGRSSSSEVTINPRGFNVRLAATYSF